jgi:hypothetical protein
MNTRGSWGMFLSALMLVLFPWNDGGAQRISPGVKVGVPLTNYFEVPSLPPGASNGFSSATRRYILGGSLDLSLFRNYSLELDALYKRIGFAARVDRGSRFAPFITSIDFFNAAGNSWEFPLLVKRTFGNDRYYFLSAGGMLRYTGSFHVQGQHFFADSIVRTSRIDVIDDSDPRLFHKKLFSGGLVGAGVELGIGRFRVVPEPRYTFRIANIVTESSRSLRFNPQQADILLGFKF